MGNIRLKPAARPCGEQIARTSLKFMFTGRRPVLSIIAILLAVEAVLCVSLAVWLWDSRARHQRVAEVEANRIAAMSEMSVTLALRNIDLALTAMAGELAECAAAAKGCRSTDRILASWSHHSADAQAFFLADPDGVIGQAYFHDAGLQSAQTDIRDREYFQLLRDGRESGLAISGPQTGRLTNRMALNLARAVRSAQGHFLGVVIASLDLSQLRRILHTANLGQQGAIGLRDKDMAVITRVPDAPLGNARVSEELQRMLTADPLQGVYRAVAPLDGVARTVAYRKSSVYPLYVSAGLSEEDYLAHWHKELRWGLTALGALSGLVLVAGVALVRAHRMQREELRRRRAAQAERLRALEKTEAILRNASDGVHLLDAQGRLLECNDRFCHMLGYTREELMGASVTSWDAGFEPEDLVAVKLPGLFKGKSARMLETQHRTKGGELLDVEITLSTFEMDGAPCLFAASRDISDRKRMMKSLAASEARFRQFFEENNSVILTVDPVTGRIHNANPAASAYYGYPLATLVQMNIADINTQSVEELAKARASVVRLEQKYFVFRHRLSTGEIRDVEVHSTPVEVDGRKQLFSIVYDITERQRARERLQLAASVFSHAHEGIMITDPEGVILDVNKSFTRITGYEREEVLGRNPRLLKSDRHPPQYHETLWHDLLTKGHWYGETWNRRKDGSVYVETLNITAVNDESGRLQCYVGLFSDITAFKEHQNQLEHIAHHDALTNLPNRVLLNDRLQQAMHQTQRRKRSMAVVFLDLDGFKAVNDTHGHEMGDMLLIAVGQRLQTELREGDTLARVGGDEFVAILSDFGRPDECETVLERLLEATSRPVELKDVSLRVTASIGATIYPQDPSDPEQLMRHADQAMYQAKQDGRNRYRLFDLVQDSAVRTRREGLEDIRRALDGGEFRLAHQPKVNLRTGEVIGTEALIRWQKPDGRWVLPGEFMAILDDHPLAVDVGEWVIRTALAHMAQWRTQGLALSVSVNVAGRQLQQPDFLPRLQALLAEQPGLPPGSLSLEILETSALEDVARVSGLIEACKDIGVDFALDDFGTGYSSLAYLKLLPVNCLKIDQSFVRQLITEPESRAIIEGIMGLARAFNREVIAEGVESVAHGHLLMALGCDLVQGYGIARPMPAPELPGWVDEWVLRREWLALRQAA